MRFQMWKVKRGDPMWLSFMNYSGDANGLVTVFGVMTNADGSESSVELEMTPYEARAIAEKLTKHAECAEQLKDQRENRSREFGEAIKAAQQDPTP